MFFALLFPLIYILIFGFLMGGIGKVDQARLGITLAADVDGTFLQQTIADVSSVDIAIFDSQADLEQAVTDRRIDFGLLWDGDALRFYFDANRIQENFAFQQAAAALQTELNLRRQGVARALPIETVDVGEIQSVSWYNLVLPGILAFSILSAGLFAVSGHLTSMKERHVLDRMIVTPMRPMALLAAIVGVRMIIVFFSTLLTLGVGIAIFHLQFDIDWIRFAVFVICATLGTMGMGTAIALVVRRPSSASSLANVLAMVMMFFAGIYFPVEFMPAFLRAISKGLPLTHMANAMRYVTGVMDMSEIEFWTITGVMLAVAAGLFPLLARYVVRPSRN